MNSRAETKAKLPAARRRSCPSKAATTSRWVGMRPAGRPARDHLASGQQGQVVAATLDVWKPSGIGPEPGPRGAWSARTTRWTQARTRPYSSSVGTCQPHNVAARGTCSSWFRVRPPVEEVPPQRTHHASARSSRIGGLVLPSLSGLVLGTYVLPEIRALRRARARSRLPGSLRVHSDLRFPGPRRILTGLGIGVRSHRT